MAACYAPTARFPDPVFTDPRDGEPGAMWRMLTGRARNLKVEQLVRREAALAYRARTAVSGMRRGEAYGAVRLPRCVGLGPSRGCGGYG
jgi:hypothetical protein